MKLGVVGVNSLLGQELLNSLDKELYAIESLQGFDIFLKESPVSWMDREIPVELLNEKSIQQMDIDVLLIAEEISKELLNCVIDQKIKIIDLIGFYDNSVSVIPEINYDVIRENDFLGLFSSQTTQLALVLAPILKNASIVSAHATILQSVSEEGLLGVEELEHQIVEIENGRESTLHCFPKQIAFNVIPHVDIIENGWSYTERIVMKEMNSLFPNTNITVSCFQVPVVRGHGISVRLELDKELTEEQLLFMFSEIDYMDVYYDNDVPTPWDLEGTIDIGVGRLRQDPYNKKVFYFWIVADNVTRSKIYTTLKILTTLKD